MAKPRKPKAATRIVDHRYRDEYVGMRESLDAAHHCPGCHGWHDDVEALTIIEPTGERRRACACDCHTGSRFNNRILTPYVEIVLD